MESKQISSDRKQNAQGVFRLLGHAQHQTDVEEKTAATYSRASYTGTTIGNATFDGRVRNGIGSDHRFIATVKN